MYKKIAISVIFSILLLIGTSYAGVHYVRDGATGKNDGSDWTNAYQQLPPTLVRGDTYYIADGSYPSYIFDDAIAGTAFINIIKATANDHGTNVGWNANYGDGQASFEPPVNFRSGYWVWNGSIGSGSNPGNYGFYLTPASCDSDSRMMGIPGVGDSSYQVNNITIKHTAFELCGQNADPNIQCCLYSNPVSLTAHNITIANNYFVAGSTNITIRKWKNSIIENNFFAGNWSSASNHGQQISPGSQCDDIILRNNIFTNSTIFVVGAHKNNNYRWKIYNNVVIDGGNFMNAVWANADSGTTDVIKDWEIHHNTYIGGTYSRGIVFVGKLSNASNDKSLAHNNLSYKVENPRFDNAGFGDTNIMHSHNSFYLCNGIINDEFSISIKSSNPFEDVEKDNYKLIDPTEKGLVLSSPFNVDMLNVTRGDGSTDWDRGAFEFSENVSIVPTNLRF
jgi:hypothetical protein